jgi:chemotaxis protein MotB
MRTLGLLGAALFLAGSVGCVPLSDYHALEERFTEQEQYIVDNKDQLREMERRERVLTQKARERERENELLRARLQKSETLRARQQDRFKSEPATLPASTQKEVEAPKVMGLEVNPDTNGLVLESGLLFAPGKATLKSQGKAVLQRLMTELNKPEYAGRQISIEGHTDDTPIKRSGHKSNWDLAAKRSLAVLHFLESKGIASSRLAFAGYGPHKPLDDGKSKQAKARNRRVEIVLYEN